MSLAPFPLIHSNGAVSRDGIRAQGGAHSEARQEGGKELQVEPILRRSLRLHAHAGAQGGGGLQRIQV